MFRIHRTIVMWPESSRNLLFNRNWILPQEWHQKLLLFALEAYLKTWAWSKNAKLISIKYRFNVVVHCWWFWPFLRTRILNSTFNNHFHVWCLPWIFQEGLKSHKLTVKHTWSIFTGQILTKTSLQSLADFIGRLRCSLLYVIILSATNFAMRLVWETFPLSTTKEQWRATAYSS